MSRRRSKKQIEDTSTAGRILLNIKAAGEAGITAEAIQQAIGVHASTVHDVLRKLGRMNLIRAKEMGASSKSGYRPTFRLTQFGGVEYTGRSSLSVTPKVKRRAAAQPPAPTSPEKVDLLTLSINGIMLSLDEARAVYTVLQRVFGG